MKTYEVWYPARPYGALGVYTRRPYRVMADSPEAARLAAVDAAHAEEYETNAVFGVRVREITDEV